MFDVSDDAVFWRGNGETLCVQAWGHDGLRVRSRMMGDLLDSDFALLPEPHAEPAIHVDGGTATIRHGEIEAVLTASSAHEPGGMSRGETRCTLEFRRPDGRSLLREQSPGGSLRRRARHFEPIIGGDHRLSARFESDPDERLYGMGQYQQDILDLKGCTLELAHRNSQASIPFVLSSAGYGLFWHNPAVGQVSFGRNYTEWHARSTRQLDYWITAHDQPGAIIRAFAEVTGTAPEMPEYGLGFWQCKLRYWNQKELLSVAREHKRRGLPLDVIVCDFFHWPHMGDFRFDEEYFPDPQAMVDELRALGIELMVSVWPQISLLSENYEQMRNRNLLVRSEAGVDIQMQFQEPSVFYDATNPAARQFVWDTCKANYHDLGITTFWLDEAEPEYEVYDFGHYRYHAGPNVQIGNLYPQAYARGFYEGQLAAGQRQAVNLLRCAWAGSQRFGALVWSGDIHSTWQDFRTQIIAGLHMGVAGIPWWTTDIGGFHGGDPEDPDFRELVVRWFQFGTFCPVMRLHGFREPITEITHADGRPNCPTGAGNEVWSFGEEAYEILTSCLHRRERLRPYVRELMDQAHTDGAPIMRTMFYEFPADETCWTVDDQYLFGPDLLVAPVTTPGARERTVYLPSGATWTDAQTGTTYDGGHSVTVDAPLAVIPVFLRDGAQADLVGTA